MRVASSVLGVILACAIPASAQDVPASTALAQLVLTLDHLYGETSPALTQSELAVSHDYSPLTITKLTPLTGDRADLEMFLLVDDCSNCELGRKFQELQRFIVAQPSTTRIGVAYIEDGKLKIAAEPSIDRERTLKALSAPTGGKPANPFDALESLITSWKSSATRRVVVLISNGIDPAAQEIVNASVEKATAAAQRAGVQVYAIYNPIANYLSTDFDEIYTGQVHLAHVAEETGGEAYLLTSGPFAFARAVSRRYRWTSCQSVFTGIPGYTRRSLQVPGDNSQKHNPQTRVAGASTGLGSRPRRCRSRAEEVT